MTLNGCSYRRRSDGGYCPSFRMPPTSARKKGARRPARHRSTAVLTALWSVRRRLIWTAWRAPGKRRPFTVEGRDPSDLRVAVADPRVKWDVLAGKGLSCRRSFGPPFWPRRAGFCRPRRGNVARSPLDGGRPASGRPVQHVAVDTGQQPGVRHFSRQKPLREQWVEAYTEALKDVRRGPGDPLAGCRRRGRPRPELCTRSARARQPERAVRRAGLAGRPGPLRRRPRDALELVKGARDQR